jgi:hypothetical protein
MNTLKQLCEDRKNNPPTTLAEARATIDSAMMFECIEKSLKSRVSAKMLKQAASIDRDGPVMLKQIIGNTFITTTPTTFATKTKLFSLNLKSANTTSSPSTRMFAKRLSVLKPSATKPPTWISS